MDGNTVMPPTPKFARPVQNLDQPQGQVAQRLRDIAIASPVGTLEELSHITSYQVNTLSEAMGGSRKQSHDIIGAIVKACTKDQDTVQAVTAELIAVRDRIPDTVPAVAEEPPQPPRPADPAPQSTARWSPRTRVLALVAALVVLAAPVVAVLVWPRSCQGSSISTASTGECIGISDGTFVFSPNLAEVSGLIAAENRNVDERVAAQPGVQAVSLAFFIPLPPVADIRGNSLAIGLGHELQGAYIAQLRANQTDGLGGAPLIRLLIANAGEGNAQWEPVVERLIRMAAPTAPEHLVAVVGFGQSLDTSRAAIAGLNQARIATIVSRLTADDLSGITAGPSNGFARVAPTNSDEARAAIASLRETTTAVMVIRDSNAADLYATTLGDQFVGTGGTGGYADSTHALIQPIEFYDSSLPAVQNAFYQLNATVCQNAQANPAAQTTPPGLTIFFAGRGADLTALISALASRSCAQIPITVFTGDDGSDLATTVRTQVAAGNGELPGALLRNITVRFTSLANPGAWATDPDNTIFAGTNFFTDNCAQCYPALFPAERLDDDSAVVGHDAVLTATVAIRGLVDQRNPVLPDNPAGALIQQLYRLHDAQAVPGASGRISLDTRGDPQRKPIPIVELQPNGTVNFVELAIGG